MITTRGSLFLALAFTLSLAACGGVSSPRQQRELSGELVTSTNSAVVETAAGSVAGYSENNTYIYKGIPYARAERFMPPKPIEPWSGIRSARAYGPTCPQGNRAGWGVDELAFVFNWDDGFADEDCLRVNIWTPGIHKQHKRPVMVWLHGGGYATGSGQELPSYDGTNLSRRGDVVVVTLNHRLNVLGFLDLSAFGEIYGCSGNAGLLDMVAALEWIQVNIAAFGGDPDNVTIFGQSGGGGKVSNLLATPAAKGLFHKAIIQSGSVIRTMESQFSRRIGAAMLEELNLKGSQVDQLQTLPYRDLLSAGEKAIAKVRLEADKEGYAPFLVGWAPTVDGDVLPVHPFSPHSPRQSKEIPLLIGSTLHEMMQHRLNSSLPDLSNETVDKELQHKYGESAVAFKKAFRKAYPDHKPADLLDVDLTYRSLSIQQARLKVLQGGAPVYMYLFAWESPVLDGALRSSHCMELPFVFDNIDKARHMTGGGEEAALLATRMSSAWLNFARTGDPNTEELPLWEPYTNEEGATMIFNNHCVMKKNHDKELLDLVRLFPERGF